MAFYLIEASYTAGAFKAMTANPHDREAAVRAMVEASGGKLHHFFFAFGEYDVVMLAEAPGDGEVAAALMTAAATGAVSKLKTTKLMTNAEGMDAMAKAGKLAASFRPATG